MKKRPLHITALANGQRADVRIEGLIASYSGANARDFETAISALKSQGIKDAHVFIDSEGGSVLEAKRIVNSIRTFGGRVTGQGGAMVASAGTYIGLHLDEFKVQKSTAYMIHKPQSGVEGNEDVLSSELKGLQDITKDYRAAYAKKTGKTEAEVEAIWSKGDRWYTGEEAVAEGFVDGLVDEETITAEAVDRIAACGCPANKLPNATAVAPTDDMDIKALRVELGMPETATEQEVLAAVKQLNASAKANATAVATARTTEVKGLIDAAVTAKKITEAHRKGFEVKFAADFDATKAELEAIEPVAKMTTVTGAGAAEAKATGREAWAYKDWAAKDLKGLQGLMTSDPDKFTALYEDHYGVKPVIPKA